MALPNEARIRMVFAVMRFMIRDTNREATPVPMYEIPARKAIWPCVISRSLIISSYAVGITPVSRLRNRVLAQKSVNRVRLVPMSSMASSDSTLKSERRSSCSSSSACMLSGGGFVFSRS